VKGPMGLGIVVVAVVGTRTVVYVVCGGAAGSIKPR